MNFGEAVFELKDGERLTRSGWNGKGMFIYYVPTNLYPPVTEIARQAFDNEYVPYKAYIALKTVDNDVVPWVASQTDILAEDWEIV